MIRTTKSFCSRLRLSRVWALILVLALLLPGCGGQTAQPGVLRVGVALYTQDDTFISTIVQHFERMAQTAEAETGRKINLSIADGRSNQTTQLEQVDRFLSQGCGVLCVNIVDRTAAAVIIDKAEAAGVPLIFFNRQPVEEDIRRWDQVYYVGVRAEDGGRLQGQIVLDAWEEGSLDRNSDQVLQYVMLEGEPGHQDALLRTEYSLKTLTDAGVEVERLAGDTANWNRGQAASRMTQWLEEFGGEIEVVFSNNDDMALGAIDVFQEQNMENPPLVVGVDATVPALEAVAAGDLAGTVLNDAEGISRAMVDLLLALTSGQDPAQAVDLEDGHYVWLPSRRVTAENLSEFMP